MVAARGGGTAPRLRIRLHSKVAVSRTRTSADVVEYVCPSSSSVTSRPPKTKSRSPTAVHECVHSGGATSPPHRGEFHRCVSRSRTRTSPSDCARAGGGGGEMRRRRIARRAELRRIARRAELRRIARRAHLLPVKAADDDQLALEQRGGVPVARGRRLAARVLRAPHICTRSKTGMSPSTPAGAAPHRLWAALAADDVERAAHARRRVVCARDRPLAEGDARPEPRERLRVEHERVEREVLKRARLGTDHAAHEQKVLLDERRGVAAARRGRVAGRAQDGPGAGRHRGREPARPRRASAAQVCRASAALATDDARRAPST